MPKYPAFSFTNRNTELPSDHLKILPKELIQEFGAFVFEIDSNAVKIAAVDPENISLRRYMQGLFGNNVEFFVAKEEDVVFVLANTKSDFNNNILRLSATATENNENITKIVDCILEYAFVEKASDIHIEPARNEIVLRFRIDGVLRQMLVMPRAIQQALTARIKIISNLKIDEYRRPQDGRIEPENFPNISIRVSIVPALFGEKIVMRVLDDSQKNISIDALGFSEKQKNIITESIEKPFGMIVASGPTGSGKTTTLYALLQLLSKQNFNISTLEDPVEYVLPGVNQIQINTQANLTFPSGLRALLRQDPDIIMVGEIRDTETASMAANAAMTGHVVFTTMHTNDAASAFTRFLEMKVDDFVVSNTVNLVIAQRLVRKICPHCATEVKLDRVILDKIADRKDVILALEEKEKGLSKKLDKITFYQGKGCGSCFNTGYLGRIGIFEFLKPNKKIHDLILNHQSAESIKLAAEDEGFLSMVTDGIDKIFNGSTTFEEVLRTTKSF